MTGFLHEAIPKTTGSATRGQPHTHDNPQETPRILSRTHPWPGNGWVDDDNLAAVTADGHGAISDWPVKAIRLIANSYTDTAEVQIEVTQSR